MRVMLVDPSQRGGIAAYTLLLARALLAEGASVEVMASEELAGTYSEVPVHRRLPSGPWGRPQDAGVKFYVERSRLWYGSAREIVRHVRRMQPDVVHFQAPLNRRLDPILLRWIRGRATVVWTAHDVLPLEGTERDRQRFRNIYRTVDQVIVHTGPAQSAVRELADVEARLIEHLVPPIRPVEKDEARRRLGLPAGERILAALGFVRAYKGYGLLADLWEVLGDRGPLLFVRGEVDESSAERAVLERIASSPRTIVRTGYADDEELHLAVAAADALLLPYVTSSDSGLLHLARAHGVPVIASDAPQLAAAVQSARAGVVVPRRLDDWRAAVTGTLPPPPPPAPPLSVTGRGHLSAYADAMDSRRPAPGLHELHLAVYTDASEFGGAEIALATLVGALGRQIRVTIVATDTTVAEGIAAARDRTEVRLVPAVRDKRDLRSIVRLRREIHALRPDVFQANLRHPWSCQYALVAAVLSRGTRVVAVEHLPVPASAPLQRRVKRFVSHRLAAHVAVGQRTARAIEALAGLPVGSVRTIYNGVPDRRVRPGVRTVDGALVVAAGRFVDHKAFHVLLRAVAELEDVSLVLVGDGPERPQLERLAGQLGLGDRLQLAGWMEDARPLLAAADVVALSSENEGFPLVVLEAMLLERPVVATDAGSVSEAVVDGQTGFVVPVGDVHAFAAALRRLVDDPELRREFGRRGRERVLTSFSVERMAASFESLYLEVSAGARKVPGEEIARA